MFKARIRTNEKVEDLALLAADYEEAEKETASLIEEGVIKDGEEVICIVQD